MLGDPDDVIEMLINDHRVLRTLLTRLDHETDSVQLCLLFVRIGHELGAHEAVEQQVVFPAFRSAVPADQQEVLSRLGEHEEINQLLAEMRVLTPDDPGFEKRASALCLELDMHFAIEEEDVFPRIRAFVGPKLLVDLGEQALAVKQTAPLFPEPEHTEHVHAVRARARPGT